MMSKYCPNDPCWGPSGPLRPHASPHSVSKNLRMLCIAAKDLAAAGATEAGCAIARDLGP